MGILIAAYDEFCTKSKGEYR